MRFLCLLCVPVILWSQGGPSSLQGLITDPSGSAVPNVAITVSAEGGSVRTARSNDLGRYQIAGLPAGKYAVRATAPGFAGYEAKGYEVAGGRAQTLNISLVLRVESEQVTVTSTENAKVDTDASNNASAVVLQKADLEALSDDRDDLAADLQALAGPAAGPNGGQIFIDGFTGGRLPPKQSIREIRINQNPFAAQFDRPGRGRIEIFTKPGTDEYHGQFQFQFSDAAFNSRNPFVTVKPPYQRRQYEGEFSGPINKKTSFFVDFERRELDENAFIVAYTLDPNLNIAALNQAVVTPMSSIESNLKIDRQLSANHTLSARFTYARDDANNQGVGGISLSGRAYNTAASENTFQVIETGVLNVHTVNETRFRFRHQTSDQSGGQTGPTTTVLDAFSSGGSPVGVSFDNQNHYELQNFTTHVKGAHSIRWGGLLRGVTLNNQAMQNYAGTFTFTSLDSYRATLLGLQNGLTPAQIRLMGGGASQFSIAAGNPLATLSQFDYGLFIQDDWRVRPTLTLSAGLRYESQTHAHDRSDIAPRIGFAWGLGGAKGKPSKNVVRGGFGIFYDRLSESLNLDALRQNGIRQQQFLILNPEFYPTIPTLASLLGGVQPQTIRETDAHWRAPMLLQTAAGFERQLSKTVTVASNFVNSIGTHALRSRNINAPFPAAGGAAPYGGANGIYLYETSGIYRQNQIITNVNAKISPKLTLTGLYAWGSAKSNTDGAGTFPANQYDLSSEYGRAGFDIHHRLQFNGSYSPKWGFRISPFVTLTSGRPYNIIVGKDLNGDGLFTDRPILSGTGVIIPRNYGNGPGTIAVNLRLGKTFTLGEQKSGKSKSDPKQLTFSVNARNVLNHPNLAPPDGNLSSPFFGRSTSLAGGQGVTGTRRLDLQVRFDF
jgi:hypothetical protein